MNKNYVKSLFILGCVFILLGQTGFAQSSIKLWQEIQSSEIKTDLWSRDVSPIESKYFSLDFEGLRNYLNGVSERSSEDIKSKLILSLPNRYGEYSNYQVFKASVLAPNLQARHPDINSFVGKNVDRPQEIVRFSLSHQGFNAIILNSEDGTQYIDALSKDGSQYMVYAMKDLPLDTFAFECQVEDKGEEFTGTSNRSSRNAEDGILRTYDLALACTEEYAQFHVDRAGLNNATDAEKKAAILGVMNDVMTRVNAIYERELSVTMQIVDNNENVIFLEDDFLSNDSYSNLLDESQQFIDANINQDYDIGHMLTTGPGGVAFLNSVCSNNNKAKGITGTGSPRGAQFEGILMHEFGHQYGSAHTFNGDVGSCSGNQFEASFAYEPGSGSTIMGYAGICGSQNIQNGRDLYFHQKSLDAMWSNIAIGRFDCASEERTGNTVPTVDAGPSYTIPRNTPYKLTGTASDAEDTAGITYCWEQFDLGSTRGLPTSGDTEGPQVRTFSPTTNNVRYIPRLEDYVDTFGESTEWEKLPSVARVLTFALTVRDNDVRGGQVAVDEVTITVADEANRFRVRSQTGVNTVYDGESEQEVRWSVANTDEAPINTTEVNILLSTDGGLNFDTVLLANTPNDGSAMVTMPNVDAAACRVMVEAVGNIFYNINTRDFAIQQSLSLDESNFNNLSIAPNPNNGSFNVSFDSNSGEDINVTIYDIRGRVVLSNSYNNTGRFNQLISLNQAQSGLYILELSEGMFKTTRKIVIE